MNAHQGFPEPIPTQPDGLNLPLLKLPQVERRISVPQGLTLLSAALEAGVPYPHSCTSGRCGACKSRLVEGEVTLGKHSPFALTDEERAGGLILACRAVPATDVTVAWLDETVPAGRTARQEATVIAVEHMTDDIRLVRLEFRDRSTFRFAAGQYLRLEVEGAPARQYSMASRPDEELVDLHVRAVPGGRTSSRIMSLQVGARVAVEGPAGSAYLRDAHPGPIVAIAGGSGLAPAKSIVETSLNSGMEVPVHLYFGARTERDLYLVEHFQALMRRFRNFTFFPVLSRVQGAGWRSGYVSAAVAEDHDDLAGAKAYVAGPPAMVDASLSVLIDRGVSARDIHADVFFTPEETTIQREQAR
ncbi:2Fe-2S iron-sulfur cluster binding domain-containing protein [Tianweitania sediminis]|uniref:2Fe-2S iron-sulfur cluster binding domain-containing protein n=2 Tax=Tianweitania sediminis TaxID=1502156 RepID=A0A8J7UKL6_9HYPH|nr:2Fe-2S iron-sulfur cluster binding domain-containing protein [Tianweitania sediminis]